MKYFWPIVGVLCIAAAVSGYRIGLYRIPYAAMNRAEASIVVSAGGYNRMVHPPRPTSQSRRVVRPSPDQLYSGCVYDLSDGPVVISGMAPTDSYWSLSFFAHNTDNYFVVNDRELETPDFRYVLLSRGAPVPAGVSDAQVVRSPSQTGIVLQRLFIDRDDRAGELDARRKTARCEAYGE